jgi:hypothetical protein
MKACREVEVQFHSFLTSVVGGSKWWTWNFGPLPPGNNPGGYWNGGCLGSRISLNVLKVIPLALKGIWTPNRPVRSIVYTDYVSAFTLKSTETFFYIVRTVHFGVKLYDDQRNAQVFNIFIYLLPSYTFRAFFYSIFRGRCTISAVVQVSWVWFQRPGADTMPSRLEPLPKRYTCLWRWAKRKPETCKAEVNR